MKSQKLDKQEEKELITDIELFDINIKDNPEDDEAHYDKAVILIKLGKQEEALECLNKAIKFNPDKPSYHAYKAMLCAEAGNYEQAKEELKSINFDQLSNNIHDKHIKNLIRDIQNKHQNLVTINNSKNSNSKEKTGFLLTSKNSIIFGEQKKLESRVENLEKENKQLKATVIKLQSSFDELVDSKNYPQNITIEEIHNNHSLNNDELVSSLGNNTEHDI